jgi:DNA-binding NarL/FixJ family response regulator
MPGLPVLVLSQYVEQLYARGLLAQGTGGVGYLLKDRVSDVTQFVDAIRRVAAGAAIAAIAARIFTTDNAVGKHTNWRARRTGDRCLGTSCRSAKGSRRFTVLVSTSC